MYRHTLVLAITYYKNDSDAEDKFEKAFVKDPVEFYALMLNAIMHTTPGVEITGFKQEDPFTSQRIMDLSKHLWKWRSEEGVYTFRYRCRTEFNVGLAFMYFLKVVKVDDCKAIISLTSKSISDCIKQIEIEIPQEVDFYHDIRNAFAEILEETEELWTIFNEKPKLSDLINFNSFAYSRMIFEQYSNKDLNMTKCCQHCNGTGFESSQLEDMNRNRILLSNIISLAFTSAPLSNSSLFPSISPFSSYWPSYYNLFNPSPILNLPQAPLRSAMFNGMPIPKKKKNRKPKEKKTKNSKTKSTKKRRCKKSEEKEKEKSESLNEVEESEESENSENEELNNISSEALNNIINQNSILNGNSLINCQIPQHLQQMPQAIQQNLNTNQLQNNFQNLNLQSNQSNLLNYEYQHLTNQNLTQLPPQSINQIPSQMINLPPSLGANQFQLNPFSNVQQQQLCRNFDQKLAFPNQQMQPGLNFLNPIANNQQAKDVDQAEEALSGRKRKRLNK